MTAGILIGVWRIDQRLRLAVALCVLLVWIAPPNLFGVGHLSERIPLLLLALLSASLSAPNDTKLSYQHIFLAILTALFLIRNLLLTIGWYQDGIIYTSYLAALDRHDTGRLGATAYIEDTYKPQIFRTNCKPLSFLLLFNGTAVPTFANPTQQPLAIIGPLTKVQEAMHRVAADPTQTVQTALASFSDTKTDTIVMCSEELSTIPPEGFKILAATYPWILYQRAILE